MPVLCVEGEGEEAKLLGSFPTRAPLEDLLKAFREFRRRENIFEEKESPQGQGVVAEKIRDPTAFTVQRDGVPFLVSSTADVARLVEGEVLRPTLLTQSSPSDSPAVPPPLSSLPPTGTVTVLPLAEALGAEQESKAPRVSLSQLREWRLQQLTKSGPDEEEETWGVGRGPNRSGVEEALSVAASHGHIFIEVDDCALARDIQEGLEVARRVLQAEQETKERLVMDPWHRIWGYGGVDFKRKECFKVRDWLDLHQRWPEANPPVRNGPGEVRGKSCLPSTQDLLRPFRALLTVARALCEPLLLLNGFSAEEIEHMLEQKACPCAEDELAASFYEVFRYDPFHDLNTQSAVVPCETHTDIGLVTVSCPSTTCEGLQVFDWSANGWVAVEPLLKARSGGGQGGEGGRLVCFALFGEHLQSLTGGRYTATPHRVVLLPNQQLPRFSQIAELLPHPGTQLMCRKAGGRAGVRVLSKDLFVRNSEGISSVNFE